MLRRPVAALATLLSCTAVATIALAGCSATDNSRPATSSPTGFSVLALSPSHPTESPAPRTSAPSSKEPSRQRDSHRSKRHHKRRHVAPARHPGSSTPQSTPPSTRPSPPPTTTAAPPPTRAPRPTPDRVLPLAYSTGSARQVLTVVAGATSDTTATVQAWQKRRDGWSRVGPAIPGFVGSAGMTLHPSESLSATPMGSWTLTRAFGREPDPGTALPYTRTTPDDWWISEAGPLYNTLQRCAADCGFSRGSPNEHLYYVTPEYDYAVVIDYNTRNAGSVRQGAGSAFFLHVSGGVPTAGCVSIDRDDLVRIMQWLRPDDHPRILIGTS